MTDDGVLNVEIGAAISFKQKTMTLSMKQIQFIFSSDYFIFFEGFL